MSIKFVVSLTDPAAEQLLKLFGTEALSVDVRYRKAVNATGPSPDGGQRFENVPRSDRVTVSKQTPSVLVLEGVAENVIVAVVLNGWGVEGATQRFNVTPDSESHWQIDAAAIEAMRATVPAAPEGDATLYFERKAKLVATGGAAPSFATATLSIAAVPDDFDPAYFSLPADGAGSALIEHVAALQRFNWTQRALGTDGSFEARFPQSSAKGWLWWLNSSSHVVGYVPETLSKPHLDVAVFLLPVLPEPAHGTGSEPGHGGAIPTAPSESEVAENPQIYAEDPGAFCKPFSNPERVLSERAFQVIVRVTQPEISPFPGRKIKRQNFMQDYRENVPPNAIPQRYPTDPKYHADLETMPAGRGELSTERPLQWEDDIAQYQASTIALGHIINYRIRWRSNGYSLGKVASSLTLAPRQVKRIQKIQFERLERARREEATRFSEEVNDSIDSSREYDDQVAASLSEWSAGSSFSKTRGGAVGFGFAAGGFVIGGGGVTASAWSSSESSGARATTASEMQRIRDSIRRHGDSLRKFESTVVTELSQTETITGTSEVVRNFNYGHSLTIIYHQILRHLKVTTEFGGVRQCLFIPFTITPFTVLRAFRWREPIDKYIRDPKLRPTIAHLKDVVSNFANSQIAPGKRSAQPLTSLRGSLYLTLRIERPKDKDDDSFDELKWHPIARLLGSPPYAIWAKLAAREKALRDRHFQQEDAPHIAAKWVNGLKLEATAVGALPVEADFTLASSYGYGQQVRVDFSVRSGSLAGLTRALIAKMTLKGVDDNVLTPGSAALLDRAVVRYGTARLQKHLSSEPGRDDLIQAMTGALDPAGAQLEFTLTDWDEVDERLEIRRSVGQLVEHLNEHVEYYHKAIWWSMDRDRLLMMLDGFFVPWAPDVSVASVIEREPIAVVGNAVVYAVNPATFLKMTADDTREKLHNQYAIDKPIADPMHISLPTDGLYAQSVLDECSALEEHRGSTDWVLDQADINPEALDSSLLGSRRAEPGSGTTPTTMPASIINLQNAPAAPPPSGLDGIIGAVTTANAFRDMAGLAGTQANAAATMQAAAGLATSFGNQAAALRMAQLAADGQKAKNANEKIAAVEKAKQKDLVGDDDAKAHSNEILKQLYKDPADSSSFGNGGVFEDAVRQGVKLPGTRFEASTPTGQLKMTLANWSAPKTVSGWWTSSGIARLADVQFMIVVKALAEVENWRSGATALTEDETGQFGHLVRYWLTGINSRIRPSALADLQAAAIDPATAYGDLLVPASGPKPEADIRTAARAVAPLLLGTLSAQQPGLRSLVEDALGWARYSFEDHDVGPWSAVFVSTVVRQAAIELGIEDETANGIHVGANELLLAAQGHSAYVEEAHNRRVRGLGGYHTFRVEDRQIQEGDIIVQDRQATNAADVRTFDQIPFGRRALHGDIVVEVRGDHCVAIGGNVENSVRYRFYPLSNGVLTRSDTTGYVQNDERSPTPMPAVPSTLANFGSASTSRIFVVLGLVEPLATEPEDPMMA